MQSANDIPASEQKVGSIEGSKVTHPLSQEALILRTLLKKIFGAPDSCMCYKEASILWGYKNEHMAYQLVSGTKQLSASHLSLLARELCKRGDTRLVEWMLSSDRHIALGANCETDGAIADEINLIVQDLGACSRAFEVEDHPTFSKQLEDLKANISRLEAEGRKLFK